MAKRPPSSTSKPRPQYGALPWRASEGREILLVTSRETGRWVIPKGWPMKDKTPSAAAALEAFEEAGAVGNISEKPLGSYIYFKFLKTGVGVPCRVKVFSMKVRRQLEEWPEKGQRTTRWFPWKEAVRLVQEPGLKAIIEDFARQATPQAPEARLPAGSSEIATPVAKAKT